MKRSIHFSTLAALLITLSSPVAAQTAHDVVRDHEGKTIRNTFEHCVITKWQGDEQGCDAVPQQETISTEMLNVYFNFDSAELTPAAKEKLDKVVDMLGSTSQIVSVDIVGYADYLGNESYNRALSGKRAVAVRDYLQSRGYLDTRNVSVEALGSERPVTNCATGSETELKACLWRDRRVEIKLNYAKQ